ncbi:hypothetical protein BH09PAT4_BH09PAT4_02370 [soil metagenome]
MPELSRDTLGQAFNSVTEAVEYPFVHPIKTVKAVGWALLAANAFHMVKCTVEVGAEYVKDRNRMTSDDS